jgi:hypothetical protein
MASDIRAADDADDTEGMVMRRSFSALLAASFVLAMAAPLMAAPETITGEVISLSCYTNDKTEIGRHGYTCTLATVKWEGNPAGILTADGTVYQIAGGLTANNNEKLWPILAHTVTITGEVTRTPGAYPTITASEAKVVSPPK